MYLTLEQLPAILLSQRMPTLVLVVSPLISLMDDQVALQQFTLAALNHAAGSLAPAAVRRRIPQRSVGSAGDAFGLFGCHLTAT